MKKTNQKNNIQLLHIEGKKPFSIFSATIKMISLLTICISTFANANTYPSKHEINANLFVTTIDPVWEPISGTIKDQNGGPIPGAMVKVKGTTRAAPTDADGKFTIEAKTGDILIISSIGFTNKEVTVTGNSLVNIVLSESVESLNELVVVGYSVQKKESLTGALSTIKGTDLTTVTSPNVQNMLAGKAPGLFVAPGSGRPGAAGAVIIRGQATLSGTTSPLWVIDGVIIGSNPGDLNPDDIESLTVLKDAASTAIYGSQGANGVIIATTKRGKSGQMTVDVSSKAGFTTLTNGNLQVMDGAQLYDYFASFTNANTINFPRWNPELRNSNFSWWDLATTEGFNQIIMFLYKAEVKSYNPFCLLVFMMNLAQLKDMTMNVIT